MSLTLREKQLLRVSWPSPGHRLRCDIERSSFERSHNNLVSHPGHKETAVSSEIPMCVRHGVIIALKIAVTHMCMNGSSERKQQPTHFERLPASEEGSMKCLWR